MADSFYHAPLEYIWMWHIHIHIPNESGYAYTLHLHSVFCKVSAVVLK